MRALLYAWSLRYMPLKNLFEDRSGVGAGANVSMGKMACEVAVAVCAVLSDNVLAEGINSLVWSRVVAARNLVKLSCTIRVVRLYATGEGPRLRMLSFVQSMPKP